MMSPTPLPFIPPRARSTWRDGLLPLTFLELMAGRRTSISRTAFGRLCGKAEQRAYPNPPIHLPGRKRYETAKALAIHPTTGEVYVAGGTNSTNFPGTTGGAQASYGGGTTDAFVARLNSGLTQTLQSTYLGGNGNDQANALAIHPTTGEVYVAGDTSSTNFPRTSGGAQATHGGGL
jgi:hypothetical protein